MNLQLDYEFMRADRERGEAIRKEVQPCAAWNAGNVEMRHLTRNLRLSAFFGITPGVWMNLQLDYEFMRAAREKGEAIRKEVQPSAA